LIEGSVSLQPAGEQDWADAIVNRPLTTGDKLWTDGGARAEIYVGSAAVRLGSNTGFSFLNVDDDTIQMRMTAGVINVRVRAVDANDQIEIDTPNLALSLLRPGNYRVEVNDEGDTTVVKVSEGEAEASGGSQDVIVHAQQAATFRGTEQLAAQFGTLGAPDAFDSWSLDRDRRDARAASSQTAQYVSPDVTGYEDLDANGTWTSEPEYGYVWTPRVVAVDWSPYRYGRWVWVSPWGWTWIDDAPWGYAPFHYGRWAHVRDRWCWVPGPRLVRPVYAPALVGWVGTPGVSVSITVGGGGGVAWFPLGPREVYVPARRFSPRYVERVNVTNTVIVNKTYITNVYENRVTNVTYRNRAVPGAVTAVSRTTFTSAERIGGRTVRIDEREITRERATAVAPQIQPVRESRLGMSEAARRNVRVPPPTVVDRQVIVKRPPPPEAAHFARNVGQRDSAREQADRLHRMQDRNEAAGRNRPNAGNDANARADAQARQDARARGDANAQADARAREEANRPGNANGRPGRDNSDRPGRDNNGRQSGDANRDASQAADRNREVRDERNAQNAQDERPPQGRLRTDRPPSIPDHINRGPPNNSSANVDASRADDAARAARDRAAIADRPQRQDQERQQREQAQQAERQARDQQERQQREQAQQAERQVRDQQERQQREQAQQVERQAREQQERQQLEQAQLAERQARDDRPARNDRPRDDDHSAMRAQMEARQQEMQRQQQANQQAAAQQQRELQQREAQQRELQQQQADRREAQQHELQQRQADQRQAQQREAQQRQEAQQRESQQREAQQRDAQQREAQREAQQRESQERQEAQQRQAEQRLAERQHAERASRPEPQRQPDNRPQQQDRDRRRPDQNNQQP
jgi:hypothetical protein